MVIALKVCLAGLGAWLALAGCAGAGAAPSGLVASATAGSPAELPNLSTKPRSVDYQSGSPETVRIIGGRPPFAIAQSNPEVADVSNAIKGEKGWTFTVGSVAGGRTVITVTDAKGATATVPATQAICLPPIPAVEQFYPKPGATGVSVNVGGVFVETGSSAALKTTIPEFFLRLIGSDDSVVTGSHFVLTPPPPQRAIEPSAGHLYWRATLPKLEPGITYKVQFADANLRCLPPAIIGDFKTAR